MHAQDFQAGSPCKQDDFICWKSQFADKFKCKQDDLECWKTVLSLNPCRMSDLQCWKQVNPLIPCQSDDIKCWQSLLPKLPCQLDDMDCWKKINPTEHLKKYDKPPKVVQLTNVSDLFNKGQHQERRLP